MRITDLHQGIVWGSQTDETKLHPDLVNRIDYDETYGTVLNRFLCQVVAGIPMTLYGTGEQTRAFIHIKDTVRCIRLAVTNPPERNDRVQIFNQMTQTMRLIDIAHDIEKTIDNASHQFVDNPRKELVKNDLVVSNNKFFDIGLDNVTLLNEHSIREMFDEFETYKDRFDLKNVMPSSKW